MADLNDKSNTDKGSKLMERVHFLEGAFFLKLRVRVRVRFLDDAISAVDNFQLLFRNVKFHVSDYHLVKMCKFTFNFSSIWITPETSWCH